MADDKLIQDEVTSNSEPPQPKSKTGPVKDVPPLPDRDDDEEYQEFLAAKAAKAAEESGEPEEHFLKMDGKRYQIAAIDDNVMGHIQAVMMFGSTNEQNQLLRVSQILEAMLVPGEYDRISVDVIAYVKRLRVEHHEFDGTGEKPPSITSVLTEVLTEITRDLSALAPKR